MHVHMHTHTTDYESLRVHPSSVWLHKSFRLYPAKHFPTALEGIKMFRAVTKNVLLCPTEICVKAPKMTVLFQLFHSRQSLGMAVR